MKLQKFILKTAFSTLIICLTVLVFIFNIFVIISPKVSADLMENLNIKQISLPLSISAYKRSKNINDIAVLIERAVKYEDYQIIITYIPELKNLDDYDAFAEYKDSQGVSIVSDYKSYIDGNYLIALFNSKKFDECLTQCGNFLAKDYTADNPARFLVRLLYVSSQTYTDFNTLLINKYQQGKENNMDIKLLKNLCVDIYSLYLGAGDTVNAVIWQNEYISYNT